MKQLDAIGSLIDSVMDQISANIKTSFNPEGLLPIEFLSCLEGPKLFIDKINQLFKLCEINQSNQVKTRENAQVLKDVKVQDIAP